jgi:hypothetical protein
MLARDAASSASSVQGSRAVMPTLDMRRRWPLSSTDLRLLVTAEQAGIRQHAA